jgi:hypothetical protein
MEGDAKSKSDNSSGVDRPVENVVIHNIEWYESIEDDVAEAIRVFAKKYKNQLPRVPTRERQVHRVTPLAVGQQDLMGRTVAVRVSHFVSGLTDLLVQDGLTVAGTFYTVSRFRHRSRHEHNSRASSSAFRVTS